MTGYFTGLRLLLTGPNIYNRVDDDEPRVKVGQISEGQRASVRVINVLQLTALLLIVSGVVTM
jgi:hypothetical protein